MISLNDVQVVQKNKKFECLNIACTFLTAGSAPSERPAEAPLAPKTGVIMSYYNN